MPKNPDDGAPDLLAQVDGLTPVTPKLLQITDIDFSEIFVRRAYGALNLNSDAIDCERIQFRAAAILALQTTLNILNAEGPSGLEVDRAVRTVNDTLRSIFLGPKGKPMLPNLVVLPEHLNIFMTSLPVTKEALNDLCRKALTWEHLQGLSQNKIANVSGISKVTLSRYNTTNESFSIRLSLKFIKTLLYYAHELGKADGFLAVLRP